MNKLVLVLCTVLIIGCKNQKSEPYTSQDLSVKWTVVKNLGGTYESTWELTNTGNRPFTEGWALYYNQVAGVPVAETLPQQVVVTQIMGTFYSITPTEGFKLDPNQTLSFSYECGGAAIKITDAPSGLYMVFDNNPTPEVVENYTIGDFHDPQQINRSDVDRVPIPTATYRYEANASMQKLDDSQYPQIIPSPVHLEALTTNYQLPHEVLVGYQNGLEETAALLIEKIRTTGHQASLTMQDYEQADIKLAIKDVSISDEGYTLTIDNEGILVEGVTRAGVFYGTQSLLALWPLSSWEDSSSTTFSGIKIEDGPRFQYRGMHLDVSRNFHEKEGVFKLLDIMAFYKLNKFHMHLSDDEGWRLAIKGIPELTSVGGTRGHTLDEKEYLYPSYGSGPFPHDPNNHGTGFYTRKDFIEILKYAHARNIEVIPEVNFPGHARAAIKAMEVREQRIQADEDNAQPSFLLSDPQDSSVYKSIQGYDDNVICVCQESVYTFIEYVVSDIVSMYQEAQVPLNIVHTGGDEVPAGIWEKSPICAALIASNPELEDIGDLSNYFLRRYHEILSQQDLITAGWEEIAMHKIQAEVGGEDDPTSSRNIMVPNPEFVDSNFLAYVWLSIWGVAGEDLAYQLANRGYKVVMSNASNLYFDFAYDKDPQEPGFYWAGLVNTRKPFELTPLDIMQTATDDIMGNPLSIDNYEDQEKLTEQGRKNILGIQGQLWSETVHGQDQLEYYVFPKLLGLAERAWAADPDWANYPKRADRLKGLDEAWNGFANTMAQKELPRMDHLWQSVNYRVPPPGAIIEQGLLKANVELPGLTLYYTVDGSEPDQNSSQYQDPVEVPPGSLIKVRAFTRTGKGSRITSLLSE